jgi:HPt (histidine-containing phosphotransfer) domain-containing protein
MADPLLLDSALFRRRVALLGETVIGNLIETFREVHGETPDLIGVAARARDFAALRHHAHKLKSAAGALGMDALAALAQELEGAAAAGQAAQVERGVTRLPSLFDATLDAVSRAHRESGRRP